MNTRPRERKPRRRGVNWRAFILLWLVIILVTVLALLGSALKKYYSATPADPGPSPPAITASPAPEA